MRKSIRFFIVTVWIVFSRSYDVYCTHQLTPDLSKEANPLVSVFGLTWTPLLLIVAVLTIYAIYAYYVSIFKHSNLLPAEKGLSFREVATYIYLGRIDAWYAMLYKYPKSFNRFNQVVGHTLTKCLVYAGVVSTIMWLLINYTNYYKNLHSAALIYSILFIGCIAIVYQWYKSMYSHYQSNQSLVH